MRSTDVTARDGAASQLFFVLGKYPFPIPPKPNTYIISHVNLNLRTIHEYGKNDSLLLTVPKCRMPSVKDVQVAKNIPVPSKPHGSLLYL
jgi:hypothetical protein